jgi:hypothetical protein
MRLAQGRPLARCPQRLTNMRTTCSTRARMPLARTHLTRENPMQKLRLNLNALDVESFATAAGEGSLGTIHGQASFGQCDPTYNCSNACNTWDTACGGGYITLGCTEANTCPLPTVEGLTCMYETCGTCNPTGRDCTTYCL